MHNLSLSLFRSTDVAVGAPWSGDGGRGQVFIYLGKEGGLSATPTQVIDGPLASGSRAAFGFALRGGVDIDGNGFPGVSEADWSSVINRSIISNHRSMVNNQNQQSIFTNQLSIIMMSSQ